MIVGMPARDTTITINAFSLAGQGLSLVGSLYGGARPHLDVPRLVELEEAGLLDLGSLIARRYPLDAINGAYDDLRAGAPGRGVITFASTALAERDDGVDARVDAGEVDPLALGVVVAAHGAEAVDRRDADVARPGAVRDAAGRLLERRLAVRRELAERRGRQLGRALHRREAAVVADANTTPSWARPRGCARALVEIGVVERAQVDVPRPRRARCS